MFNKNKNTTPVLTCMTFVFLEKNFDGKPELKMYSYTSSDIGFGMLDTGTILDPNYMIPLFINKQGDTKHQYANTIFGKLKPSTNIDGIFWKIMTQNIFGILFSYSDGMHRFYHPVFSGENGFEENTLQDAKLLDDGSLFFKISDDYDTDQALRIYEQNLNPIFEGEKAKEEADGEDS